MSLDDRLATANLLPALPEHHSVHRRQKSAKVVLVIILHV